jgi:predicted transposase YdaD
MLKKKHSRKEIEALFFFIDWVVRIESEEVQQEYLQELRELAEEEEEIMQVLGNYGEHCKKEGRVEGRMEGRKEGWKERNETLAVEMLQEGFVMPVIVKFTGLTEEEIRTLAGKSSC